MKLKNKIESLNNLYIKTFYFYRFGRYEKDIQIIHGSCKPYLENKYTHEIIKGLNKINKYLELYEIEFEEI